MRYWLDCEFIEDGITIDLISIAAVSEDGREFYLCNAECDLSKASKWVKHHVLPKLPPKPESQQLDSEVSSDELAAAPEALEIAISSGQWITRRQLKRQLYRFIGKTEKPELWFWIGAYDWVAICQLFGPMNHRPKNWPKNYLDVEQLWQLKGRPAIQYHLDKAEQHQALNDARWCKRVWEQLTTPATNAELGTQISELSQLAEEHILTEPNAENTELVGVDSSSKSGRKRSGFASMSPERRREIAAMGGKTSHQVGKGHEFSKEEAKLAGQIGGTRPKPRIPKKKKVLNTSTVSESETVNAGF